MMSFGAKGVVSVAGNLVPDIMVQMTHLCLDGKFDQAAKFQLEYLPLMDALFSEVNPIPIKAAMNLSGRNVGTVRLPLLPLSEQPLIALKKKMQSLNLLS